LRKSFVMGEISLDIFLFSLYLKHWKKRGNNFLLNNLLKGGER